MYKMCSLIHFYSHLKLNKRKSFGNLCY